MDSLSSEIKVGDQVRTTRGYLGKVVAIRKNGVVLDIGCGQHFRCSLSVCKKVEKEK